MEQITGGVGRKGMLLINLIALLSPTFAIDSEKDGPIYGNSEGLSRVSLLEERLHNLTIK